MRIIAILVLAATLVAADNGVLSGSGESENTARSTPISGEMAAAFTCHYITTCWENPGAGRHEMMQGPIGSNSSEPAPFHSSCKVCLLGDGNPEDCHDPCEELEDEDEEVQVAYSAALSAAKEGRLTALLEAARFANDFVVVNRERGAIQIWSCTKTGIVATVPYSGADLPLIEASGIPDLEQ